MLTLSLKGKFQAIFSIEEIVSTIWATVHFSFPAFFSLVARSAAQRDLRENRRPETFVQSPVTSPAET